MSNSPEANPLLQIRFDIPFDQIKAEHVRPAVDQLIAESQAKIQAIAGDSSPRTYANTMQALEDATERLDFASGVVRHLESVATYPELREVFNAIQAPLSEFYSGIVLHEGLWKAIKAFAETEEAKSLDRTKARLLKKTVDSFRRHGADLDPAGKKRIAAIDVELAELTTKFSQNVLDSTNAFEHIITDEAGLAGLPQSAIDAAKESAEAKKLQGWRFTLQGPSYNAVMTYLDDASVRENMYRAYNSRASSGGLDNRKLVLRILELRREKAAMLGKKNFADWVLEDRMAHNGDEAWKFLEDLRVKTEPFFQSETQELIEFRNKQTGIANAEIQPWDVGYYAEKLRLALYDFDEEALRPYFPLEKVVAGMFEIYRRVFAIRVVEKQGVPVWDPKVKYYVIEDDRDGSMLGAFYADFYPRENKRGGAWMDALITGIPLPEALPHVGLICGNLTPPAGGKPALLTHNDVETLFHEFGHLLHHCLSRVEVRSLAGTNVAWDFVELPSQIMENWCWEREALDFFAKHWETGEPIPEELFDKMHRARNFRSASAQMRQLSFGTSDLALHCEYDPERDGDVIEYSRAILQKYSAAPLPAEHAMMNAFTHLFASPVAYAAGYYSYKWAEVLDADAFTRFKREGIFNQSVGLDFREKILARGDSEDPADLYKDFMGRGPDPNALLERLGLAA